VPGKSSSEGLLEPLRTAIRLEQEGRRLFREASRKATGPHARQTFDFLASEEDRHIEQIRRFYESTRRTGGQEPPSVAGVDPKRRLADFEDTLARLRGELSPTMSDVEAYKFALKFETGAEEYYREKMNETDNPNVRTFYDWLIHEEKMHAQLLSSCLEFATDPAGWFRRRGRS